MDDKELKEFTQRAKEKFFVLLSEAAEAQPDTNPGVPRMVITPDRMSALKASDALVEALAAMAFAERNQPGRHGGALKSIGSTLPNALSRAGTPMETARKVASEYIAFLEEECRAIRR